MNLKDIKHLHVEITSKCNAWCPDCPRNNHGKGLVIVPQDLDLEKYLQVLARLPSLETVQFCGNFGDPCAAKEPLHYLQPVIDKQLRIKLHTNGSLRSTFWWVDLARKIKDIEHEVIFAIDGLEDTHSIYRQATNYKDILSNAQSFISAGGKACWQMLLFKHNEHQVIEALKTSRRLGFQRFDLVRTPRIPQQALDYRTGKEYKIEAHTGQIPQELKVDDIRSNCMHLNIPSIYLDAEGKISHCCYLAYTRREEFFENLSDMNQELNDPGPVCESNCRSVRWVVSA